MNTSSFHFKLLICVQFSQFGTNNDRKCDQHGYIKYWQKTSCSYFNKSCILNIFRCQFKICLKKNPSCVHLCQCKIKYTVPSLQANSSTRPLPSRVKTAKYNMLNTELQNSIFWFNLLRCFHVYLAKFLKEKFYVKYSVQCQIKENWKWGKSCFVPALPVTKYYQSN